MPWALAAQFWPLYALLLVDLARRLVNLRWPTLTRDYRLQADND
jgi:hypothetical protein